MPETLQIQLLGNFVVYHDTTPLPLSERAQTLLAYLLLHPDTPQPRQHIAFRLWPDSTEAQARTNLRSLLHQVRQRLPDADEFIATTQQTLQWRHDAPATVDLFRFQHALAEADRATQRSDRPVAIAALKEAVTLYGGDLLPGNYEEWLEPHREALRLRYATALGQLVEALEQADDFVMASRYAEQRVQHDPLDESAAVALMRLRAQQGDRSGVRRAFQKLESALQNELDVPPGPSTLAAYEQWVQWEPPASPGGPAYTPPPPVTPGVAPLASLPPAATPLVGREGELETLRQLVTSPSQRLITLTGPGGMGKTRLALEVAHRNAAHFEHGALWVRLQAVHDPDRLTATLADALGLRFHEAASHEEQLHQYLSERHLLLILDNFEHLLERVGWVAALLAAAPRVTVLVTSRVRLNLREEWVWEVGGLPVPADDSPGALEASAAARLFRQAAQQVQHTFAWDSPTEQAAVARLCHLLEGMPLALELAAAWGRLLPPSEILQELEQSLDFLRSSQWNLPARHRSLRAVFDQSWSLLAPDERALLRTLSIFRGPFTREAAVQVSGATLERLGTLLDNSLLRRMGDGRFMMHEAIRQYAATRLEAHPDEERTVRDRHLEYFTAWVEAREWPIKSARQHEVMTEVAQQTANIHMAWDRATQQRDVMRLARMLGCLMWYWEVGGFLAEGQAHLQPAVAAIRAGGAPHALDTAGKGAFSFLLDRYGWGEARLGRFDPGIDLIHEALTIAESIGHERTIYYSNVNLGFLFLSSGRLAEAERHARQALDAAWGTTGEWGAAIALAILGWLSHMRGDVARAQALLEESLTLWRRVGDPRGLAFALNFMSGVAEARGANDEMIPLLQESIAVSAQHGDRWAEGSSLNALGKLLLNQGEVTEALACFEQSQRLFQEIGEPTGQARALLGQSTILRREGRCGAARSAIVQALHLGHNAHNRAIQLQSLLELAVVLADERKGPEALELLMVALPEATATLERASLPTYEALRQTLQDQLAPEVSAAARARAEASTVEAHVAGLLGQR